MEKVHYYSVMLAEHVSTQDVIDSFRTTIPQHCTFLDENIN